MQATAVMGWTQRIYDQFDRMPYGFRKTPLSKWVSVNARGTEEEDLKIIARIRTPTYDEQVEKTVRSELEKIAGRGNVDVQYTGPVYTILLADRGEHEEILRIGSSVALAGRRGGTLTFFARDRETGEPGFVSANHVIGGQDAANAGDEVVHPARSRNTVGRFVRSVQLSGGGQKLVDCAFARLITDAWDPATLPGNQVLDGTTATVSRDTPVQKFGATLRHTTGIVSNPDDDRFELIYRRAVGLVEFDDQIEIKAEASDKNFALPGDSGSLVVNAACQPVGLLFSQSFDGIFSYANPIAAVLEKLNVELIARR